MATLDEAIAAVVTAVDALETAKAEAEAPAPVVEDEVRKAVETVLLAEGWVAPTPAADPTVAEDVTA